MSWGIGNRELGFQGGVLRNSEVISIEGLIPNSLSVTFRLE